METGDLNTDAIYTRRLRPNGMVLSRRSDTSQSASDTAELFTTCQWHLTVTDDLTARYAHTRNLVNQ
jgi:hypothetical protein